MDTSIYHRFYGNSPPTSITQSRVAWLNFLALRPVLDDVEETFHEVALAIVEREVALARRLAICPRRNDGLDAADFEMLDEALAIIAFVGEEGCGFDFLAQDLGLRYVVNVSAGEAHRQRIA